MGKAGRPILRGKVDKGLGRAMYEYVCTYVTVHTCMICTKYCRVQIP